MCESRRHVVRRAEPVDGLVVETVLVRLTQPDALEVFAQPDSHGEARALREEEAGLRTRLDGLSEAFAEGDIDREQLRSGSHRLQARLAQVVALVSNSRRLEPAVLGTACVPAVVGPHDHRGRSLAAVPPGLRVLHLALRVETEEPTPRINDPEQGHDRPHLARRGRIPDRSVDRVQALEFEGAEQGDAVSLPGLKRLGEPTPRS